MHRPRVILESRDFPRAAALAAALVDAGMDPVVCTGPTADGGGCPLLTDEPCPVVIGADAVVFDLDLDRAEDRDVLRSLVVERAGLPIITEQDVDQARRHPEVLGGCTVVLPFSAQHTAEAVVAALTDRHA